MALDKGPIKIIAFCYVSQTIIHFVGPDLGPDCLQRLSAASTCNMKRVKMWDN